jgi:hypothetical protein
LQQFSLLGRDKDLIASLNEYAPLIPEYESAIYAAFRKDPVKPRSKKKQKKSIDSDSDSSDSEDWVKETLFGEPESNRIYEPIMETVSEKAKGETQMLIVHKKMQIEKLPKTIVETEIDISEYSEKECFISDIENAMSYQTKLAEPDLDEVDEDETLEMDTENPNSDLSFFLDYGKETINQICADGNITLKGGVSAGDQFITFITSNASRIGITYTASGDLLNFWTYMSTKTPFYNLAQIAFRLLCLPASEASVERVFSAQKLVSGQTRYRSSQQLVDARVKFIFNSENTVLKSSEPFES